MANYHLQHVASGPVLQCGEGHGEAAVLGKQALSPQVGLLIWSAVDHWWKGRVVLGVVVEQLHVPALLLMAGPSWRFHGISLKPVPEQAASPIDEKGESFPELLAWAWAEKQWWNHSLISPLCPICTQFFSGTIIWPHASINHLCFRRLFGQNTSFKNLCFLSPYWSHCWYKLYWKSARIESQIKGVGDRNKAKIF